MAKRVRKVTAKALPTGEAFESATSSHLSEGTRHGQWIGNGLHVVRLGNDYVERRRTGGPLAGGVIPGPIANAPSVMREDVGLVRVYARSQQESQGPYVDRPMYTDYIEPGRS